MIARIAGPEKEILLLLEKLPGADVVHSLGEKEPGVFEFEIIPAEGVPAVACSSRDKGKDVMKVCKAGCIGCMKCAKVCESGAVTVEGNLARIDYEKCTGCGKCKEECPRKIIG